MEIIIGTILLIVIIIGLISLRKSLNTITEQTTKDSLLIEKQIYHDNNIIYGNLLIKNITQNPLQIMIDKDNKPKLYKKDNIFYRIGFKTSYHHTIQPYQEMTLEYFTGTPDLMRSEYGYAYALKDYNETKDSNNIIHIKYCNDDNNNKIFHKNSMKINDKKYHHMFFNYSLQNLQDKVSYLVPKNYPQKRDNILLNDPQHVKFFIRLPELCKDNSIAIIEMFKEHHHIFAYEMSLDDLTINKLLPIDPNNNSFTSLREYIFDNPNKDNVELLKNYHIVAVMIESNIGSIVIRGKEGNSIVHSHCSMDLPVLINSLKNYTQIYQTLGNNIIIKDNKTLVAIYKKNFQKIKIECIKNNILGNPDYYHTVGIHHDFMNYQIVLSLDGKNNASNYTKNHCCTLLQTDYFMKRLEDNINKSITVINDNISKILEGKKISLNPYHEINIEDEECYHTIIGSKILKKYSKDKKIREFLLHIDNKSGKIFSMRSIHSVLFRKNFNNIFYPLMVRIPVDLHNGKTYQYDAPIVMDFVDFDKDSFYSLNHHLNNIFS